MDKAHTKAYIEKHKNNYSKQNIKSVLLKHKVSEHMFETVWNEIHSKKETNIKPSTQIRRKKGPAVLALICSFIAFFPNFGFMFAILAIILASVSLSRRHKETMSAVAIFIAIFGLLVSISISANFTGVGSLMPDKVDAGYRFRGYTSESNFNPETKKLNLVFTYNKFGTSYVSSSGVSITDNQGNSCRIDSIKNLVSGNESSYVELKQGNGFKISATCENFKINNGIFSEPNKISGDVVITSSTNSYSRNIKSTDKGTFRLSFE